MVVTADALHAQRSTADYLHGRGAHYVLTVKRNQPNLYAQLKGLPWTDMPVAARTRDGGHSRAKTRTVVVTAVRAGILFPHATQAIQVVCCRRTRTGRWRTETVYAVTSLAAEQADPAELADAIRGHWHVENRLHWVATSPLPRTTARSTPATAPRHGVPTQPRDRRPPPRCPGR